MTGASRSSASARIPRAGKRGVVVNIESTVQSIQRAVEEAELMAGCEIHSVYAGIAGSHVRSLNSHGIVAIRNKVTPEDVDRVIDAARAGGDSGDQKILHPAAGIPDRQPGRHPRADRHVGRAPGSEGAHRHRRRERRAEHREVRAALRARVEDVVLEQLASSYAVLADDEKELGVCLVDIGGGTTDIACSPAAPSATPP